MTFYVNTSKEARQYTLGELLEQIPLPREFDELFDCVPYQELLESILTERTRAFLPLGRPGYPLEAMLKAYLGSYFIDGITSLTHLVRRLQNDVIYALACGFDIREPLPSRSTFSRFIGKLAKHQELVEKCLREIVNKLRRLLPNFADVACVDCTPVSSWANPSKKPPSDPEAGLIYKGTVEGRKKWTFGYRFFIVSDAVHELPISIILTHAKDNERKMLLPLLRKTRAELPWLKFSTVSCDAGFDKYDNFEGIVKEFDAEPVIALAYETDVRGSPAAPACRAGFPFIFTGWRRGQLVYQCPEKAGRVECPLPARCPHKQIMLHPVHDYRKFGYHIRRDSQEYKELYNKRSAAERVNSRLKEKRRLDSHCFRKRERINVHVTFSVMAMLSMALSKAHAGKLDEIRACGRRMT